MPEKVIIIGGGGHARCVLEAMLLGGKLRPAGIIDAKLKPGSRISGVPVLGGDSCLPAARKKAALCFVAVGSVGDASLRVKLAALAAKAGFSFPSVIHPSAAVSKHAALGAGSYVAAGAVINPGAEIGKHCIINTGAVIDHDCRIGDFAHIAPGAALSGGVTLGRAAHIGTGACAIQGITIGQEAVAGAGSVIVSDIPARAAYCGNPARRMK